MSSMSPPSMTANDDDPDKEIDGEHDAGYLENPVWDVVAGSSSDTDEDADPDMGYQLLPQHAYGDEGELPMNGDGPDGDGDSDDAGNVAAADWSGDHSTGDAGHMSDEEASNRPSPWQIQMPHIDTVETEAVREVWKHTRHSGQTPPMDQDHAEEIKNVMARINLPSVNMPPWASVIPETDWKTRLITRLHDAKSTAASHAWAECAHATTWPQPEQNTDQNVTVDESPSNCEQSGPTVNS